MHLNFNHSNSDVWYHSSILTATEEALWGFPACLLQGNGNHCTHHRLHRKSIYVARNALSDNALVNCGLERLQKVIIKVSTKDTSSQVG